MFYKKIVATLLLASGIANADCQKLLRSPPRGLNCLYCMHENAPRAAEPITDLLLSSCISNPGISFVTDGTFGWNEEVIRASIDALKVGKRKPWLHLYLYNGPAQRRWRSGAFTGFAQMEPGYFREAIKSDPNLREQFKAEVNKILPLIRYAKSKRVKVTLAIGLEDNLDNTAFDSAVKLIKSVIPKKELPTLVRSPCSDCAVGNEVSFPQGILQEKHTGRGKVDVKNGIVSTDGDYFRFASDKRSPHPKLTDWIPMLQRTGVNKSSFLLWIAKYQDTPAGVVPLSPDKRNYLEPTSKESAEIQKFLRGEAAK